MSLEVFVGLGSNLGDRAGNLQLGISSLGQLGQILRFSSLYETEPWGREDQPHFINAVCSLHPFLRDPELFFGELKRIEKEAGRRSAERWGPRELDLDLLFWGDRIMTHESLSIPHPLLADRRFVLVPLCQIAPDLKHPLSGLTVHQMLESCTDPKRVEPWGEIQI